MPPGGGNVPRPISSRQRYLPGLDGLRAIAVLAVIAYHEQFGWAQGGLLGVGVFFTLSGFLITSLLLDQWSADGAMRLRVFWLHRARRLLPALFVMLAVVTAWVTAADRARLGGLRSAVAAASGYFSNWYLIAKNQSYFARFAPPAPMDHLWSLAVEEQFYLLWPLLLLAGLLWARKRGAAGARRLLMPTLVLAAVSFVVMDLLYQPGMDPTRVYEGTDTRAFGLLIGAALAMAWPGTTGSVALSRRTKMAADGAGLVGLAVIGLMVWRVGEYSPFAYRGGLVLLSVATTAVVASVTYSGGAVAVMIGCRPLRWIGVRSYGIYLWHFPVIVLTTPLNAGPNWLRAFLQTGAAVLLAALSWKYIEEPVRHGAIGRLWARSRSARASREAARPAGPIGAGAPRWVTASAASAAAGVVVLAGAGLSGLVHGPEQGAAVGSVASSGALQLPVTKSVVANRAGTASSASASAAGMQGTASQMPMVRALRALGATEILPDVLGPLRTSCAGVVHIGDSTSDGLNSPSYLPNPRQRIVARYLDVGARTVIMDVEGARSIVEVLPGGVNAHDAARRIIRGGFRGCWVLALGTDDTADVAAGSNYSIQYRIVRMMAVTRGEPVLWVNVKSLVRSGPYAESNMRRWNQALLRDCARYPNMRIYDWAAEVTPKWFISDGIHYTSLGYENRAKMIAAALAHAFPQTGESSSCVVSS